MDLLRRPQRVRSCGARWRRRADTPGSGARPGASLANSNIATCRICARLRWPESDHAIHLTVNDVIRDGRRAPFEIFINSKNLDHYAWTLGLTRMISAVFRRGGDVSFVVDELKAVFDPRGGSWMNGRYVPSLLAAIGDVLETHMKRIGFIASDEEPDLAGAAKVVAIAGPGRAGVPAACPRCSQPSLIHQEGCAMCTSCGWSQCA